MSELFDASLAVTVVGGYLGSGKTTLINQWLRHADGQRLAILVNDFGELPIDADLIESEDGDVINLSGGCVCCSYGNDLTMALIDLLQLSPRPDHVVLEASGVALLGAIASSLGLINGYRINCVLTLADTETVMERAQDKYMQDTIERQLSDADIVVMTKADLVSTSLGVKVKQWLAHHHPHTPVLEADRGRVSLNLLLDAMTQYPMVESGHHRHDNPFQSYAIGMKEAVTSGVLADLLIDQRLGILRAKGFFRDTDDRMKLLQLVGRRCEISNAKETMQPGLVVIGVDLVEKAQLEKEISGLE